MKNKDIKIKDLNIENIDNIVDFIWNVQKECNQIPVVFQDDDSKEIFKSGVTSEINADLKFFGAFEDEKMIGILGVKRNNISYLYVSKEHQRKKVGTILLRFALEILREYDTIYIESVDDAKKFYKKNGFKNKNNKEYDIVMEYKRKKFRIF